MKKRWNDVKDGRPWAIPYPKGILDYIQRNCQAQAYIIFSNKAKRWTCTRCGEEGDLESFPGPLIHSKDERITTSCPCCGSVVVPKDARYGRKKLKDHGRLLWSRGYGKVTIMELSEFEITYQKPHPRIVVWTDEQIRLSASTQERVDWRECWWYGPGYWQEVKKIGLKRKPNDVYGTSSVHDHIWWEELRVGSDLQYANLDPDRFRDTCWDEHWEAKRLIGYMSDFLKYPAIEILEKSGFEAIVMNRAEGYRSRYLNVKAKDLRKILKCDGADVKALREHEDWSGGPTIWFLDDIHNVRKYAPWAKVTDVPMLSRILGTYVDQTKLELVLNTVNVSKLMKKMLDYRISTEQNITLSDYADYLSGLNMLGRRLDKKALYPKDFMAAHDEVVNLAKDAKDEDLRRSFVKQQIRITGMQEPFASGEYVIRPAAEPKELREESRALCHCVRTYVPRVAEGRCAILFIRRVEDPETPFFTLELAPDGSIVQCRGDHNKAYPKEVKEFIDEWMAWMKKQRRKKAA